MSYLDILFLFWVSTRIVTAKYAWHTIHWESSVSEPGDIWTEANLTANGLCKGIGRMIRRKSKDVWQKKKHFLWERSLLKGEGKKKWTKIFGNLICPYANSVPFEEVVEFDPKKRGGCRNHGWMLNTMGSMWRWLY